MHSRALETQSRSTWDITESMADPGLQPGASFGSPRSNAHKNSGNKEPTYTRFSSQLHHQGQRRMSGILHNYFLLYSLEARSVPGPGVWLAARKPQLLLYLPPHSTEVTGMWLHTTGVLRIWTQVSTLAQVMLLTKLSSLPRSNFWYQWAVIYNSREDLTPASRLKQHWGSMDMISFCLAWSCQD